MTDICDAADQTIEPDIMPNGECYFCGAAIDPPRRWCDASCRDDWEIINK